MDFPEEPDELEVTPPQSGEIPTIDIKVSNYDLGRMMDASINAAMQNYVGRSVEKWVEKKVSAAVDRLVKSITTETIKAHVEKTLAEGWGKVNEWGEQRGEKITLSTVVREGLLAMSAPGEHNYNGNARKPSPMLAIVQEMAAAGVKEGLQPILDEAKAQLRTTLDVQFGKGLRLTLADVLKG